MKNFYIAVLMLISVSAFAQDEAIFNHYIVDKTLINPAAAGFDGTTQLFAHYRNQWSGFKDAPATYNLTFNTPITDKVGVGALVTKDNVGAYSHDRYQLNYAYHYTDKLYKWSVGFSTEFHNYGINSSVNDINTNPTISSKQDYLLASRIAGASFFDATFGAITTIQDKVTVGFTLPNLIRARLGQLYGLKDSTPYFLHQFTLYGAYKIAGDKANFEPSVLFRKPYTAPFEVEINFKGSFLNDALVAGFMLRPGSSGQVGLIIGTKQPQFSIYYSYGISISQVNSYLNNANEITFAFEFKKPEKNSKQERKKKKSAK